MIKELADFLDLEWFSDFNMPEITFNVLPCNKVIYDNDYGYCVQYKNTFKLIPIDTMSEEDQLKLLKHLKTPTLKNCLLQLERAGWSTLIDSRWEEDVKTILKESFPEISDELLQEVLDLVLV